MIKVIYEVVQHDGGWAYRVGDTFSEPYSSHDQARKAADMAATEQVTSGASAAITYEDKKGEWHTEYSKGNDRPETEVKESNE